MNRIKKMFISQLPFLFLAKFQNVSVWPHIPFDPTPPYILPKWTDLKFQQFFKNRLGQINGGLAGQIWNLFVQTCGLNNFITAGFPYIPISLTALNPSGVTRYISILELLARIKFKSLGPVKFPKITDFF